MSIVRAVGDIKRVFREPTPIEVARRELQHAELAYLEALTARDYAESLCEYNAKRTQRLREYIARVAPEQA